MRARTPVLQEELGTTLVEFAVFTAVIVPMMVALAAAVGVFSSGTIASHHRANTNGQNHRILQFIVGELTQTSTKIDHVVPGSAARPQPGNFGAGTVNEAYDRVAYEALHALDDLHDNLERDGQEEWHTVDANRRFYIYATFEPFDTIEYQRVRTPEDMSHVQNGGVEQPWSTRRKIFRMEDKVLLRVERDDGTLETAVLGTGVTSLAFHLNMDGEVIIRVATESGDTTAAAAAGARLTTQVTVNPRNGLN